MNAQFETGHARNAAMFIRLANVCASFGTRYNPSREEMKQEAINALAVAGQEALNGCNDSQGRYRTAVAKRELAFKEVSPLITRVMLQLRSSATNAAYDEIAQSMAYKYRGIRIGKTKVEDEAKNLSAEAVTTKRISASQTSFDNRVNHLDMLIQYLDKLPEYNPNEVDLQLVSLRNRKEMLLSLNIEVAEALSQLNDIRLIRNTILYKPLTGMVDLSVDIKNYIRSEFGPRSEQVKKLAGITLHGQRMQFATEESPMPDEETPVAPK